jgi:ribosome-associated toxin RatA of RatAB toxin-antitoxin module
MRTVHREAIVPHAAETMYDLVNDIEAYPRFLPWCPESEVLERGEHEVKARLTLSRGGLRRSFTTLNRMEPGRLIDITLIDGPFRHLEGEWHFHPLRQDASRVSLDMSFDFSSRVIDAMLGPVFHQVANSLVDAFVRRARELYG